MRSKYINLSDNKLYLTIIILKTKTDTNIINNLIQHTDFPFS